jgi:hypothetical protein
MKTEDGYRFSLSFLANTPEQEQVGKFLEALGSKKSRLIVKVLSEYILGLSERPPEPTEIAQAAFSSQKPRRKSQPQTIVSVSETIPPTEAPAEQTYDEGGDGLASMLASMSLF